MTLANKTAFVLLFVVIVFTILFYGAVHQPIIAVFYVLTALLLVLWAVDTFRSGTVRVTPNLIPFTILATAVYGLIQVIPFGSVAAVAGLADVPRTISADPFATQVSALHFLALFIFVAVAISLIDTAGRLRKLVAFTTIFGFAYAFFAILQGVLSPGLIYGIYEPSSGASPFGSFVNRHNFAAFIEMAIALPLGMLFAGAIERDKRLLYLTAIALMGVALLLSGSRGGLVAFFAQIVLLVILAVRSRRRSNRLVVVALAGVLIVAIIGGSFFVGGETSLSRAVDTAGTQDITTDRSHIWSVTLDVITNNLPFGAGLGAFGVAYTPYDSYSGLERVEQAHNDYLQVVSDAGIPGVLIGLAFLFLIWHTARKAISVENTVRRGIAFGAIAGIFAILVHSIFDFVLHTTAISVMFLTLVALLAASSSKYEDDIEIAGHPNHRTKGKRRSPGKVATFQR